LCAPCARPTRNSARGGFGDVFRRILIPPVLRHFSFRLRLLFLSEFDTKS
jgi:hypothetical protein